MTLPRRAFLRLAVGGLGTLSLGTSACAGQAAPRSAAPPPTPTPPEVRGLAVYSPEDRAYVLDLAKSFARQAAMEISVPPLGRSGAVTTALRRDREQERVIADVVYGGGPYTFYWLEIEEILARGDGGWDPYVAAGTLPSSWQFTDWIAYTFVGTGQAPPGLGGLLALAERHFPLVLPDPRRWDYGTMLILAILAWFRASEGKPEPGWDFLRAAHRQPVLLPDTHDALVSTLRDHSDAVALVPSHFVGAMSAELPGLWSHWPDEIPVQPNVAAVARGAPHPEQARSFISWLGSGEAQQIMLRHGRIPANCQLGSQQCAASSLLESRATPFNVVWAYENYNEVRREWDNRTALA